MPVIVIDGANGTGTSTQCQLLQASLEGAGKEAVITSHPGSTKLGQKLRELLKFGDIETTPQQDLFLFATDTVAFYQEYAQSLKDEYLICDRLSLVSFYAYQATMGASYRQIHSVIQAIQATREIGLDRLGKLFVLDAPYKVIAKRINHPNLVQQDEKQGNKKDRYESRGNEFMKSICRQYSKIAGGSYSTINNIFEEVIRVDAAQPIKQVHDDIIDRLNVP